MFKLTPSGVERGLFKEMGVQNGQSKTDCRLQTMDCNLRTADSKLWTSGKVHTEGNMQTSTDQIFRVTGVQTFHYDYPE